MRRTPIHVPLLIAATLAALTGCSRLPTAPSADTTTAAAVAPGSAPVVIGHIDDPHPPSDQGTGALDAMTLDVGQSGAIRAGRFTLYVHKNSLKVPATITMSQPNLNVMEVEFTVSPAAANDFQVPLKLVADCSDDSPDTVRGETIFWSDGTWTAADKKTVTNDGVTIMATSHTLLMAKVAPKSNVTDTSVAN